MATTQIAWNDGSGDYITLTYTGQGNGTITASSPANKGAARSKVITINTTQGGLVTKNVTVNQAACPFPVNEVRSYSYTGSYQEVELPAGQYKLQVWGAQGGSNGTNSTYGITAKAGGKGGYSEGILTLSSKTTVRVYVGGQGSASAGGYNGGGSTTGTSQYDSGGEFGYSKMGGGGGATDIRLSDGALLSRMIVAGGGGGGSMCYRYYTTSTTVTDTTSSTIYQQAGQFKVVIENFPCVAGRTYTVSVTGAFDNNIWFKSTKDANVWASTDYDQKKDTYTYTVPSGMNYLHVMGFGDRQPGNFTITLTHEESSSGSETNYQVGYVGGGTTGGGYSSTYQGKQNAAGTGGSFGQGANMATSSYRYCSGAGGGGWYGGGSSYSDNGTSSCKNSGGGSGWVNTSASAGNRPSGYTGLQLDSGTTYAGNTSFPNTAGTGNETGHSGNGYAKITRLA